MIRKIFRIAALSLLTFFMTACNKYEKKQPVLNIEQNATHAEYKDQSKSLDKLTPYKHKYNIVFNASGSENGLDSIYQHNAVILDPENNQISFVTDLYTRSKEEDNVHIGRTYPTLLYFTPKNIHRTYTPATDATNDHRYIEIALIDLDKYDPENNIVYDVHVSRRIIVPKEGPDNVLTPQNYLLGYRMMDNPDGNIVRARGKLEGWKKDITDLFIKEVVNGGTPVSPQSAPTDIRHAIELY